MKRYVYYFLGMNILVLGITCNTLSHLGVGAFSTLPFAISSLSALTFGQANIIFYLLFVFLQIVIERKISVKFVLEIPFSFIFGFLIDFYQYLIPSMDLNIYTQIIYVFLTIFLYLLKCPQSLILSALRAFCFCGKPHISRSIFLYFRYQAWLKSW